MRYVVCALSGRSRFNVLGALDAMIQQLITVTNTTYSTSIHVIELLNKLAARHHATPITVVLDTARNQHCAAVTAHAATVQIEWLFLPPYSPNLIERVWRFVKKEAWYSAYYADFHHFTAAITDCLDQTQGKHQQALARLLTLNFQTLTPTDFSLG